MRPMASVFLPLLALVACSAVLGADRNLSGKYAMEGTSLRPNSRPYVGECELARQGPIYQVNCTNTDSGDKYVGKGIQRGDLFSLYLGEYLVVYRVESDGKLNGNWAHAGSDDYGREALVPKR